jgi:hypothetical protein
MPFFDVGGDAGYSVVHLEGWALVRVQRDLEPAVLQLVLEAVRAETGPRIALDLERHAIGDGAAAVAGVVAGVRSGGRTIVVVSCDEAQREALRAEGVADVQESLDDALAVDAPAIVFQHDRVEPALPPSQADVTVMTANDLLGPGRG